MTEVLTTIFAPMFVMIILVFSVERFITACLVAAGFVTRLLTGPQQPVRPLRK